MRGESGSWSAPQRRFRGFLRNTESSTGKPSASRARSSTSKGGSHTQQTVIRMAGWTKRRYEKGLRTGTHRDLWWANEVADYLVFKCVGLHETHQPQHDLRMSTGNDQAREVEEEEQHVPKLRRPTTTRLRARDEGTSKHLLEKTGQWNWRCCKSQRCSDGERQPDGDAAVSRWLANNSTPEDKPSEANPRNAPSSLLDGRPECKLARECQAPTSRGRERDTTLAVHQENDRGAGVWLVTHKASERLLCR